MSWVHVCHKISVHCIWTGTNCFWFEFGLKIVNMFKKSGYSYKLQFVSFGLASKLSLMSCWLLIRSDLGENNK